MSRPVRHASIVNVKNYSSGASGRLYWLARNAEAAVEDLANEAQFAPKRIFRKIELYIALTVPAR